MGRYWQGLQVTIGLMSDRFRGQTNVAAFDVGLNILFEARPIIFPADELFGFIDTKMACQRVVVVPVNELGSNDFRYKRQTLVVQHPINVLVSIQAFCPDFPDFFIQLLQLC